MLERNSVFLKKKKKSNNTMMESFKEEVSKCLSELFLSDCTPQALNNFIFCPATFALLC